MQMRNGSFRKYMPDHYKLGYLLVSYGRKKYGDSIWRNITADAASFKPLFYPFQHALQKYTGISYTQFVADALKYFQHQWDNEKNDSVSWLTNPVQNDVVDYKYPYATIDGKMVVLKKSLKKNPEFISIDAQGKEEKIVQRSIAYDDYYSYKNGRIVYAAYQPDLRWGNREFNALKLLDLNSRTEQTIIAHSKYYSPDISNDGLKVIAIELDPIKGSSIVLLNQDGTLINRFHTNGWLFASIRVGSYT